MVQVKIVLAHLTEGESWSIVQNCRRHGLGAWRGLHKQSLESFACDHGATARQELVARYNKQNAKVEEVELADDIQCSAVESVVLENLERHLRLNAMRLKRYDDVGVDIYAYFES